MDAFDAFIDRDTQAIKSETEQFEPAKQHGAKHHKTDNATKGIL